MEKAINDTIRDVHPGFTDAQAGSAGEIRNKAKTGCLKKAHRKFEQGIQCVQVNSMHALASIQNSGLIMHSPYGCAACASFAAVERFNVYKHQRGEELQGGTIITTALGEKEVILGGEKRLEETVRTAIERHSPKMVFILASCAAAIIGDDIDAVAGRMQDEYPDVIFAPIHCEGF